MSFFFLSQACSKERGLEERNCLITQNFFSPDVRESWNQVHPNFYPLCQFSRRRFPLLDMWCQAPWNLGVLFLVWLRLHISWILQNWLCCRNPVILFTCSDYMLCRFMDSWVFESSCSEVLKGWIVGTLWTALTRSKIMPFFKKKYLYSFYELISRCYLSARRPNTLQLVALWVCYNEK